MVTKVYGMHGYRETNIQIPVGNGKVYLQREFTRGNPQRGAYYAPATYVSSDSMEQMMIESSPLFKRGSIQLIETIGQEEPEEEPQQEIVVEKPKAAPVSSRSSRAIEDDEIPVPAKNGYDGMQDRELEIHEEITTNEQMLQFLKSRGAKATVLRSQKQIDEFISSNGFSFPNMTK